MNFLRMLRYYRERGYTWINAVTIDWKVTR